MKSRIVKSIAVLSLLWTFSASLWAGPILSQDFASEGFPPEGWNTYSVIGPVEWMRMPDSYKSEPASAKMLSPTDSLEEDWLVGPVLNLEDGKSYALRFWDNTEVLPNPFKDYPACSVMVATSGGPDPSIGNYQPVWGEDPLEDREWGKPVRVSLEKYKGSDSLWIAWVYYGKSAFPWWIDDIEVDTSSGTSIKDNYDPQFPYERISSCPNPFSYASTIKYKVAFPSHIALRICDVSGRLIRNLVNEYQSGGAYSICWDGRNKNGELVRDGVYFCQFKRDSFTKTKKIVMIKERSKR